MYKTFRKLKFEILQRRNLGDTQVAVLKSYSITSRIFDLMNCYQNGAPGSLVKTSAMTMKARPVPWAA
jgi:hypothetical protein